MWLQRQCSSEPQAEMGQPQSNRARHHFYGERAGALLRDNWRDVMNSRHLQDIARTCCAFCRKTFPVVNGEPQFWRAPTGLFFCNEICADDAEEAMFQSRRKSERKDHEKSARVVNYPAQ
jgi:ribosomal protein L37AE/L43A